MLASYFEKNNEGNREYKRGDGEIWASIEVQPKAIVKYRFCDGRKISVEVVKCENARTAERLAAKVGKELRAVRGGVLTCGKFQAIAEEFI